MLRIRLTTIWVLLLVVASGCSGLPTLPPMPTLPVSALPSSTPAPTLASIATPLTTQVPSDSATALPTSQPGQPTSAVTNTPYTPFTAKPAVEGLNLRVQPGHLSEIIRMLDEDAVLSVLGQTPGGEWIFVQNSEGISGWVFKYLLTSASDLNACPVLIPDGVQVVRGQLTDKAGLPLRGVQFAVEQGDQRSDGITDAGGIFFVFLPASASGEWVASYTAINCSSPLMDADCNCLPGACNGPDPVSINFSLPTEGTLTFIWK
jgi:hypothetical protein